MSDRENETEQEDTPWSEAEPRQPPTLSREEARRIEQYEDLEEFMEEPTSGSLGVISDEDVPGEPG